MILPVRTPLLLALALLGGSDDVHDKYALEKGPDVTLAVGEKGAVTLRLLTRQDGYIHPEAPLKIKLSAEGAVGTAKSSLERKDAVDPKAGEKAHELAFQIPVAIAAGASGAGKVRADLTFFLCSPSWCRQVKESLSWSVTIKK